MTASDMAQMASVAIDQRFFDERWLVQKWIGIQDNIITLVTDKGVFTITVEKQEEKEYPHVEISSPSIPD